MKKLFLLDFQRELIDYGLEKLNNSNKFVFQSPTGTGKTFICANLINEFIEKNKDINNFTFLFFAPSKGRLDFQGYEKFKNYKKSGNLKNYYVNYQFNNNMIVNYFEKNNIYFFGWDKLIKDTNNLTNKDSEQNNFWNVLKNTIKKDLNLFIIIDEQHLNKVDAKKTKEFLEDIEDILTFKKLEMSATVIGEKKYKKITYEQAVNEAIVKKEVIINDDVFLPEETIEKTLIKRAIEKQKKIIERYRNKNLLIKEGRYPLIVIQIPDKGKTKRDKEININNVAKWVIDLGINKKHIAIYTAEFKKILDERKIERNDITDNDDIHILIFKQAIATGWDIPRANIWIKLRLNMNEKFEIQTLGRVLRNQFLKYFNDPLIDNAYIYTLDTEIKREIENNYSEIYKSKELIKRNPDIKNFDKFKIAEYFEKKDFDENHFLNNILLKKLENMKEYNLVFEKIKNDEELSTWFVDDLSDGKYNPNTNNNFNFSGQIKIPNVLEYNLYRRYKFFEESINNFILQKYLEKLIRIKSKEYNQNNFIKKAYKYFYKNSFDCINLKNNILKIINKHLYKKELTNFSFNDECFFNKDYLNQDEIKSENYDKNNFYLLNFEKSKSESWIFDSRIEKDFYTKFTKSKEKLDFIKDLNYILYNFVDQKNYFYVNYIDKIDGKIRKYFPDFLISTEKNLYIFELKQIKRDGNYTGENVDFKKDAILNLIKNKEILLNNNKNVFYEILIFDEKTYKFKIDKTDLLLEDYFIQNN